MMTTRLGSQTLAALPNSRLNTPMVPGPQTSCVMSTSAFTQMLSPACTEDLPAARARIFSVNVIGAAKLNDGGRGCNRGKQCGVSHAGNLSRYACFLRAQRRFESMLATGTR